MENSGEISGKARKQILKIEIQFKNKEFLNIPKCPIEKKCYLLPTFNYAKCRVSKSLFLPL